VLGVQWRGGYGWPFKRQSIFVWADDRRGRDVFAKMSHAGCCRGQKERKDPVKGKNYQ